MLARLSVWSEVQIFVYGPADATTTPSSLASLKFRMVLGRTFVKRFTLCYGTVVCLSVSNVNVLWPDGCMDQDATWYGRRPWPTQHSVRRGPNGPPFQKRWGAHQPPPHFSANVYCAKHSPISATAELLLPFWCWLTQAVLVKTPLTGCFFFYCKTV